jgi:hypothetical protein
MKKLISLTIFITFSMVSCDNVIQETMNDKDAEKGKFESSKWGNSKFGK